MMPTKTTLKAVGWTLATLALLNQFEATRGIVTGSGKKFFN